MDSTEPTAPTASAPAARLRVGDASDGVTVRGTLSPSRASDFTSCALLYRFRAVDRLPEPPSVDATRGTLVHRVLEQLFDLPADRRTPQEAAALLRPAWEELVEAEPALGDLHVDEGAREHWWRSCARVLERYFTLEDPRCLEPAEREVFVEHLTDEGLVLRGIVDRVDVAPDGAVRVVDYKTGRAPGQGFEAGALFQMRFYALVWWRTRGVLPRLLQLVYLGDGTVISHAPDEDELLATERRVHAIWAAIRHGEETGDFQPRTGPLCRWCAHQALCPAYGGTPPPLPVPDPARPGPPPAQGPATA
ncbi:MAG: PD-(D/E)XK nuclease family protein [Nocardioides sp.]|nr:PD-(D/E)XK nuclease family protein [Nocardioides sp.]